MGDMREYAVIARLKGALGVHRRTFSYVIAADSANAAFDYWEHRHAVPGIAYAVMVVDDDGVPCRPEEP